MKRFVAATLAVFIAVGVPAPAFAYLKYGVRVGANTIDLKWVRLPVRYFVTERGTAQVPAAALAAAVNRAFATWQSVPSAAVRAEFQGMTIVPPGFQDGRSTFGFLDRPELDRVLGATSFLIEAGTGRIVEADILFNTRFTWTTEPRGEANRVDLESVALHEIGHLLGLGHSALGETETTGDGTRRVIASGAVMFPIAMSAGSIADRVLQPDDIAGISDLYPTDAFLNSTGSITGRVMKSGQGIFGAHIAAFNVQTGETVGNFTLNERGEFVIAGLRPGHYVLRAEPLDDVDTDAFFTTPIDTNFHVGYGGRLIVVAAHGGAGPIAIAVRPR